MRPRWRRVYDFGNGLSGAANRFAYFTPLGLLPNPDVGLMADVFTAAGGSNQMTADDNIVNTQTQFPIGVWKHVAITTSAGVQTMYVDGFPVGTLTGDAVPASQLEPLNRNPGSAGRDSRPRIRVSTARSTTSTSSTRRSRRTKSRRSSRCPKRTTRTGASTRDRHDRGHLSDYKNTAALENGVTWDSDARLGGAVQLPGGAAGATGPTIELAKNPLADCTNQLTIAAWVKLDALTAWTQIFEVTSDVGVTGEEWIDLISYDGAAPHFAMITSTGDNVDLIAGSNPFDNGSGQADGKWHHIAVTVAPDATDNTKNDVVMYGDGAVIGSTTTTAYVSAFSSTTTGAPMTNYWLGKSRFNYPYLAGSLDIFA